MKIIDISVPVDAQTAVYPGDTPFSMRLLESGTINTSEVKFTPHVGTHIDAPWHFGFGSAGLSSAPLRLFVGEALVTEPKMSASDTVIDLSAVPEAVFRAERVLFKVSNAKAGLSERLARKLADAGVRLVGISAASIDPEDSTAFPAHRVLLSRGIFILENIDLSTVPVGVYELHAAPLAWDETEASPVRAYLMIKA